jgi:hypothetical protein
MLVGEGIVPETVDVLKVDLDRSPENGSVKVLLRLPKSHLGHVQCIGHRLVLSLGQVRKKLPINLKALVFPAEL